ncbi:TetR family transcriptional regulator [Virgibacillus profundi]|uniref:TetR family transcriptional regulator n=1 Tax=Virgibacillus profundi TaxID=2024555 RepID=A0A2A2IH61_9BACI|nr:TetR/AcrR family transcriptional regulator [Virgibacillus profundi]PAV30455.1 TetR family transcriptional regulator [Virgibacillus profundi]PXY54627.1 TetR/AcrR family transcriptional regulator [Virgibacillus profundi]
MARERKFSKEMLYITTRDILLSHGYEGFTFGKVAERLNLSRGTIYKYYENKEELISDYMVYEMEKFLIELKKIDEYHGFRAQFEYLLEIILEDSEIHQIRSIAFQIPSTNNKVKGNIEQIKDLHQDMYKYLQNFVDLGRKENLLKRTIPDSLVLGFIFQTVDIPNHFNVPLAKWNASIKEMISHGMLTEN